MKTERSIAADLHDQFPADQEVAEQVSRAFGTSCNGNCVQGRFCDCQPDVPMFADTPSASAAIAVSLVLACVVLALILSAEAPFFMQWVAS